MTEPTSLYRRELLKKIAAAGALHSCGMLGVVQQALAAGELDVKQGIISAKGEIVVSGQVSRKGAIVQPGHTVRTRKGAEAIYVIGQNAFLQRESSVVHFGTDAATDFMRVVSGRILSVFGKGNKNVRIAQATIGIRGTAFHIGVEPERAYFCLCYGAVEVKLPTPDKDPLKLTSAHHDHAVYLPLHEGGDVQPAGMQDHNDDELKLLEALVGRLPPFMQG